MPILKQIKDKMKKLHKQAEKLIAKRAVCPGRYPHANGRASSYSRGYRRSLHWKGAAQSTSKLQAQCHPTQKVASISVFIRVTPPKYRHPKTGVTWTAHRRAPGWIVDAKDRSKFLIDDTYAGAVRKVKTAAKKTVAVDGVVAHKR